jgi:TolB protein
MQKVLFLCMFVATLGAAVAAEAQMSGRPPVISVVKKGADKDAVTLSGLKASGPNGQLFVRTLTRDLELSGWFKVAASGAVSVSGAATEAGGGIQTGCRISWPGKSFGWAKVSMGPNEVRRQAHQLADEMVRLIKGEKGIAQSRIVFVNRRGRNNADLYVCDADGQGMMQLTRDNVAAVGPRWAPNGRDIYYTSFLQGYPSIVHITVGGGRSTLAAFRGLNTGAAISPDGGQSALILSYQGTPSSTR